MPRYDQRCLQCGWAWEIETAPGHHPSCPQCGGATERLFVRGYSFVKDEFPGGKTFENLGHEPVTVYSKSELKREMEMRGLVPAVRHVGTQGSDKSPHTSRWI